MPSGHLFLAGSLLGVPVNQRELCAVQGFTRGISARAGGLDEGPGKGLRKARRRA